LFIVFNGEYHCYKITKLLQISLKSLIFPGVLFPE